MGKTYIFSRKSQVSFEFITIFTLVFFVLVAFFFIMNTRLAEINEQQEITSMRDLANSIKNEVLLASSVNNNYLRRFDIPSSLSSKDYSMSIENDELTIKLLENDRVIRDYFTVFPSHVKGSFIDEINYSNKEHCITKNNFDGIRIARNQASIDASVDTAVPGSTFDVYLSLNCVEDVRSAQFTIHYDNDQLELVEPEILPITYLNKELGPLFEDLDSLDYGEALFNFNETDYPYIDQTIGRFTYGIIGKNCATGSGNIAKLVFKVKPTAQKGTTTIDFDSTFGDQNLIILDCTTSKSTENDIPDSKNSAKIVIT